MSQLTKTQLEAVNQSNFPNNNTGFITPTLLRDFNTDIIDSMVDESSYGIDSGSWNQRIDSAVASGSKVNVEGDGTPLGTVGTLNFSGSFDIEVVGDVATIGIVGGGSGTSGTSGTAGTSGVSGTNGVNGTNGTSGVSGTSGQNGTSGTSGVSPTFNSGSYATTGSNNFVGNQSINGNLNVTGAITASSIYTQYETASVIYSSGSNQFGDALDDTQTLWGSVVVTGSLTVNGTTFANGTSGTSGTSGVSGTNGTSGIDGTSGTSGVSGTNGINGTSGTSGTSGVNGQNGQASGRVYYFNGSATASISGSTYNQLGTTPIFGPIFIVSQSLSGSGVAQVLDRYLTDPLGFSIIPGGLQTFHLNLLKQAENDNIQAQVSLQLADVNGTPSGSIITSSFYEIGWNGASTPTSTIIEIVFPTTTINSSSRMIVDVFAKNNDASAHNLNFYTEGDQYSFVVTSVGLENGTSGTSGTSGQAGTSGTSGVSPSFDSGSYATTGSNTFTGEQIISSSVIVTDKVIGTGSLILKPDVNDPRFLEVYNTAAQDTHITASGGYLFLGDDTTYVMVDNYGSGRKVYITADNGLAISGSTNLTGSIDITGDYKVNGVPLSTASIDTSAFATTGSNTFEGNQTINGVAGGSALIVSKSLGIFAPEISVGDYNSGNGITISTGNNGTSSLASSINMVANQNAQFEMYANGGNFDSINISVTNGDSGVSFKDWDGAGLDEFMNVGTLAGNVDFKRNTNITGSLSVSNQANLNGGLQVYGGASINGASTFNAALIASGGLTVLQQTSFEGGLQVNGPVRGNTTSPALVSGSIQLNWNTENFFSIELAETASTFIDVVNINEAQTINVRVRTQPSSSVTFSENVWQKSGSLYTPTNGVGIDILTFVAFDNEYAYLANVTNFSGSYIEPPTTTTTTAAGPYEFTNYGYDASSSATACGGSGTGFWTPCSTLGNGCRLSPGSGLAAAMDNGFYSNGTTWYQVTGGDGVISSTGSCA